MKIYDSILFFNEIDILEIRMNLLNPYVDFFIISECDTTFSGLPKKFIFDENSERFEKFKDKIIHVKNYNSGVVDVKNIFQDRKKDIMDSIINEYEKIKYTYHTNGGAEHWCRDYLHREFIKLGMENCEEDDIIIFGDADEIPNLEKIQDIKNINSDDFYCFLQDNNNFFVNNIASTNWKGNIMSRYKNIREKTLNSLRIESRHEDPEKFIYITNGGWHLSFMGGADRVKEKIKSYGHQEFNNSSILDSIENNINNNKDLFNRNNQSYHSKMEEFYFEDMKKVDIDGYFPENIVSLVRDKFKYLIK